MALILFDPKSLRINVQAGVLEKYEPTDDVKKVAEEVEELKKKADAKKKELEEQFKKFSEAEIDPAVKEIQKKIMEINSKRYPELKKFTKVEEKKEEAKPESK